MRARLGDTQDALVALARSVAVDTGATSIADLPPAVDADRAWAALADSGLLTLRASGASTLDLVLCAEQFAAALSATPFIGATLARELHDATDERIAVSLDGRFAHDALGAERVVFVRAGHAHMVAAGPMQETADRSRVTLQVAGDDVTDIAPIDERGFAATTRLLLAADLVGTGIAALETAIGHVLERRQFGVPVGSFQAVQHLLADAWVDLVAARAAVRSAAWRAEHETPDASSAAARSALVAAEAGVNACEVAAQVLGGIGHTWEHLVSVRLRRALVDRALLPTRDHGLLDARLSTCPAGSATSEGFDLRDDEVESGFRDRLRSWLATDPPTDDWHRQLARAGFVGVSMPVDAGGQGLPVTCEAILSEELGDARMPAPPAIAHLAHALATFGTADQRRAHLAPMLDGSRRWCQGFSEPEAGSDLASLRTRAVLDGEDYIVDGRKIWTSDAAQSDWILLLCRTGDDIHGDLSVLLIALDTPGVEVSPIVTAWGSEEFAEVSFSGVRVPRTHLLGSPGQGWEIAMSLLAIERGPADIGWIARFRATANRLLAEPDAAANHDLQRAAAWIEALDAVVAATLSERRNGSFRPIDGSIDKLVMTKVDQLLHAVALERHRSTLLEPTSEELERYLWSRAAGIFGGTSQIQRNIVAQRVLGLPKA